MQQIVIIENNMVNGRGRDAKRSDGSLFLFK